MVSGSRDQRSDPFAVLGLGRDADPSAIREARRRLAKQAHPDRGGDARRMQDLNRAADAALAAAEVDQVDEVNEVNEATDANEAPSGADPPGENPAAGVRRSVTRIVEDMPSFLVEAVPAEAFRALVAAAVELGHIVDDDPPYLLDVVLRSPYRCWCRLEVLPEAGAASVGLVLGGLDGELPPDVELVRDRWIETLNAGSPLPAGS